MFRKSQRFYDAIYAWKEYRAEADRLLSIIRQRVPEARSFLDVGDDVLLLVADMTAFDLDRTFDVVTCLFSSIAYTRTRDRLDRAVSNLARHAAPGGLVIVEPWFFPEAWTPGHVSATFVDVAGPPHPDLPLPGGHPGGRRSAPSMQRASRSSTTPTD